MIQTQLIYIFIQGKNSNHDNLDLDVCRLSCLKQHSRQQIAYGHKKQKMTDFVKWVYFSYEICRISNG